MVCTIKKACRECPRNKGMQIAWKALLSRKGETVPGGENSTEKCEEVWCV